MKKVLALDIGDTWTGTALSDALGICARPHQTYRTNELHERLNEVLANHTIDTIVVGEPKTLRGTHSEQTTRTRAKKEELENTFPSYTWILWDERLSSKRAQTAPTQSKKIKNKQKKIDSHSVAAAFILDAFLKSPKRRH